MGTIRMEIPKNEVINELVSVILSQDREIKKLKNKIKQITQYLDTYEEYIMKGDI